VKDTELWEQAALARAAFRNALARPEHRQLFDYWESLCGENGLPCRSAFSPHQVRRLLPAISLIDVARPLMHSTVRLAGTRLRELYGKEITGLPLSEVIDCNGRKEAYGRAVEAGEPQHGTTPTEAGFQHWLKLPLRCGSNTVSMVLCLDVFESAYENRTEKKLSLA
jgi:PAS domain